MSERTSGATLARLPETGAAFHIGRVYPNGHSNGNSSETAVVENPGDLQPHHILTYIALINSSIAPYIEYIDAYLEGRNGHNPQIREAEQIADTLVSKQKAFSREHSFPSETSIRMSKLMADADAETKGLSNEHKAAARLAKFDGVQIATDHDGTWTDLKGRVDIGEHISYFPESNYLKDLIPTSAHAEYLLKKHTRKVFPFVFTSLWRHYLTDERGEQLFRNAGHYLPLRDGAKSLLDYLGSQNTKVTFVSHNFKPIIEGLLDKMGSETPVEIQAITSDSLNTLDKSATLHALVKENPTKPIIFIGDGETDFDIVEAYRKGIIATIFALEGVGFDTMLTDQNIPHFTFRDLNDIRVKLEELTSLANTYRTANANAA
ncbi:hypothetical protein A2870_03495 [Candidatus Curtissbacteria bacterium RIFCSPHIGHO2_01_FULL_41_11]|uniref:Uncharacterized protein n=1 Tax=Candidatus Curtissbacteria bacterium RIFCSPHIGHO2_01_FULL_41_11 TaxID=1797711 RepID=A0A1F5G5R2_9BACT|nr:MAG: hypothetical protein A2870_03495 [Candidatus Curtissbacteria bacterium RIFCSPHIGHO2_01_FULL_41_11]